MKVYNTKEFKKNNYFILYDLEDNIVCYFDNFYELSTHINYNAYDLARRFNCEGDLIKIIIGQTMYKLYTTDILEEF